MKLMTRRLLERTELRRQLTQGLAQSLPACQEHLEQIEEMIGAAYERHFSEAELSALAAFYASPLGRLLVTRMPLIHREIEERGRDLAEGILMRS